LEPSRKIIALATALVSFIRLTGLRPIERFLAQWIAVSTEPSAFVRERIRLDDTTNFLRAAGFFVSAISTAFLAEVATLYLLGIGNLAEPYYWIFIVLTSIPFVLICFLLVRPAVRLSLKDVLHLSLYPIGAGVFSGAIFALVASAIVAALVAVGSIPAIKYDVTQWGDEQQVAPVLQEAIYDCLKQESFLFTIVASGFQEAYTKLKEPIGALSYVRPIIVVLYFFIAALVFRAAVDRRKSVVFGLVLLAALVTTMVEYRSLKAYANWSSRTSDCWKAEKVVTLGWDRYGESALKEMARGVQADAPKNELWELSVTAEGRTLLYTYHFKRPWPDAAAFHRWLDEYQKGWFTSHCSNRDDFVVAKIKATETHAFYSSNGERLTSFSISPADCSKW
jgi:hypothetical protein